MKKHKWLTLLLLFTLILSSISVFVHLNHQSRYWKEKTAEYNYNDWNHIYHMATELEQAGITMETMEQYHLFINAYVHNNSAYLMPAFNGSSSYSFLGTYYDALAQSLVYDDFSEDDLAEGLQLFEEMNTDLISLCELIFEKVNENETENKCRLVEADSQLYKEVSEKIVAFCDMYDKKIKDFYTEAQK